jgi:hypothetical protein
VIVHVIDATTGVLPNWQAGLGTMFVGAGVSPAEPTNPVIVSEPVFVTVTR